MKNIYPSNFIIGFFGDGKREKFARGRKVFFILNFLIFFSYLFFTPSLTSAQSLTFSYSYENVTRNNGGGTLETGDIIEVHALMLVNSKTTKNVYYIDTICNGAKFMTGSLKILTNEGLTYYGPYTDASNDDAGVYDASYGSVSRVRVNIGSGTTNAKSGSNLVSTSGGGTITPGTTKPKFYGGTLLMVAYKLQITASFGDTIHLTGNYYFDTTSLTNPTTYHFAYPGIKVIQNSGLCSNFSSASFTTDSSFGSGNTQNRVLGVAGGNDYVQIKMGANAPGDGYYAIANNTSTDSTTNNTGPYKPTTNAHRVFGGFWDIIGDHTGAADPAAGNPPAAAGTTGGYMLVVNAAFPMGEAFHQTISNVCPNTNYEFSAWVRNICSVCGIDANSTSTYTPGVLPNLSFDINGVGYYTTGDIPYDATWQKRGFMYKTGPSETSFTISIKNNAAGGGGDDWVIDDIKLATCYPNLQMNPSDTATACAGWPITLSDTIKSFFNNYVNYRWETSTDGINWVPSNLGSTRVPQLINGLYVYYVDTVITPLKADSATYFRVKVATTSGNLSASNCSVDKSQKVFLKVYSTDCPLLDVKILNFNGAIINDKAVLKWSSQNENDLKEYVVQRSPDGIHFSDVGQVEPINDLNTANYTFEDPDNFFNVVYYRLELINRINNDIKYSRIISLYNKNTPFKITTINPFTSSVKMDVFLPSQGNVEFSLCDMYGNAVNKKAVQLYQGNSNVSIDNVGGLPPGLYILRALFNGSVLQYKLIKTN